MVKTEERDMRRFGLFSRGLGIVLVAYVLSLGCGGVVTGGDAAKKDTAVADGAADDGTSSGEQVVDAADLAGPSDGVAHDAAGEEGGLDLSGAEDQGKDAAADSLADEGTDFGQGEDAEEDVSAPGPCSEQLNPQCAPVKCAIEGPEGAFVDGLCALDPKDGKCKCGGGSVTSPCSSEENPACEPAQCKTADGKMGECVLGLDGKCTCMVVSPPQDPCSSAVNPMCKPSPCETEDGQDGQCGKASGDECRCVPLVGEKCTKDVECLALAWVVDCNGHWDCVAGQCEAKCGAPCGDGLCQPKVGEGPLTCPSDCGAGCKTNAECGSKEWCAKPIGDCDGVGLCETLPDACPMVLDPVCGCDGKKYDNACLANANGVNVKHKGPCSGGGNPWE